MYCSRETPRPQIYKMPPRHPPFQQYHASLHFGDGNGNKTSNCKPANLADGAERRHTWLLFQCSLMSHPLSCRLMIMWSAFGRPSVAHTVPPHLDCTGLSQATHIFHYPFIACFPRGFPTRHSPRKDRKTAKHAWKILGL